MTTARSVLWSGLEHDRHLALIDDALDTLEATDERTMSKLRDEIADVRVEVRAGFVECKADSKATRRLLTGLLVTIVGSSVAIMFTVLVAVAS